MVFCNDICLLSESGTLWLRSVLFTFCSQSRVRLLNTQPHHQPSLPFSAILLFSFMLSLTFLSQIWMCGTAQYLLQTHSVNAEVGFYKHLWNPVAYSVMIPSPRSFMKQLSSRPGLTNMIICSNLLHNICRISSTPSSKTRSFHITWMNSPEPSNFHLK